MPKIGVVQKKKVGLRLEEVLDEKNVTKYRFAKLLGKNTSNIFVYFNKDYNPTLRTMEKWAKILKCKISDLIDE